MHYLCHQTDPHEAPCITCVQQLKLIIVDSPAAIFLHQPFIRVGGLRVLVQRPHVRVGGRAVQVVVQLLHVLPVVTLQVTSRHVTLRYSALRYVSHVLSSPRG